MPLLFVRPHNHDILNFNTLSCWFKMSFVSSMTYIIFKMSFLGSIMVVSVSDNIEWMTNVQLKMFLQTKGHQDCFLFSRTVCVSEPKYEWDWCNITVPCGCKVYYSLLLIFQIVKPRWTILLFIGDMQRWE